ncbi:acyl carrier protein [Gilvibacter sediminis]|uniref:acyl carrier protein n=1 Tax=Gilvibacter sediminis TaxID=379071 RepID=UPI00234FDC51|nr:acyl carrier protein [Gilvibacter sediminis]MDC7998508.1 acyl carrier protein [Gilvibacter sediminis]
MNDAQFFDRLKEIISPYVQNQEAFTDLKEDTRFIEDLQINSANLVDVVLDVEDAFDIEIDNDSMEKMLTVEASLKVIKEKLEG